jgi:hypothetical protein
MAGGRGWPTGNRVRSIRLRNEIGGGQCGGPGGVALDKLQVHQPTRRIINEHEQRALRTTILKPPVLAVVDLH